MTDLTVLKTLLETDPRYDAVVVSGNDSECLRLLNEEDPTSAFIYLDIEIATVLEAAGQVKLAALTADQRSRLLVLKNTGDRGNSQIALSRSAIRAELLDVFGITEAQLVAGIPGMRRRGSFAEEAGVGGSVSLNDVRAVI